MAAFKFFNIGKANEEVARLEARVQELEAENAQLKDNGPAIAAEAEKVRGELTAATEKLTKAEASLQSAQGEVAKLTGEKEKLSKDLEAANAKIANPGDQIKQAASAQAANIVAGMGAPDVETTPNANPAATAKAPSNLTGLDRAIAAHKSSQTK